MDEIQMPPNREGKIPDWGWLEGRTDIWRMQECAVAMAESPMNPKWKEAWVKELRTTEKAQGLQCLRSDTDEFCCLGVLADQMDPDGWDWEEPHPGDGLHLHNGTSRVLAVDLSVAAGLNGRQGPLTLLNDTHKLTFPQIADMVEHYL